jgi:hypothetical protein
MEEPPSDRREWHKPEKSGTGDQQLQFFLSRCKLVRLYGPQPFIRILSKLQQNSGTQLMLLLLMLVMYNI